MARKRSNETVPAKLKQAQARFEEWREIRETRRIPDRLWKLATSLAREFGVYPTSRALRLNYESLKTRLKTDASPPAPRVPLGERGPSFVEIPRLVGDSAGGEGTAEFELGCGARLQLSWRGPSPDLTGLSRAFFGGEAG